MKLTSRVSAYFLVTLAVALTIYSLVLYSMARSQIEYQFQHELRGVLASLIAAAEIEETEVKWQPLEHTVSIGSLDEFGEVDWVVVGDKHRIVEKSPSADQRLVDLAKQLAAQDLSASDAVSTEVTAEYHVLYQRLTAPNPKPLEHEADEFDELAVVVSRSTVKRDAMLSWLMMLVTLLPLVAWTIAAGLGSWLVRQALKPVAAMSGQAQSISGSDIKTRLIVPNSRDELADLGTVFNQLLDRQQAAFEGQKRFAGNAAHELRSPITVLLGQIEVALRRPRSCDEYVTTLELLRSKTLAFQEIVEALLLIARSEDDSIKPTLQPVPIRRWLDEHVSIWQSMPRAADIKYENSIDESLAVKATSALLARVIDNLVTNAMKYSSPGTPIVIQGIQRDDQVLIRVIDKGNGIAEADCQHIFDPFFRSSEARRLGIAGNGLGLAIAHRIAATLAGSLSVQSEAGSGSCFELRLPINHTY